MAVSPECKKDHVETIRLVLIDRMCGAEYNLTMQGLCAHLVQHHRLGRVAAMTEATNTLTQAIREIADQIEELFAKDLASGKIGS